MALPGDGHCRSGIRVLPRPKRMVGYQTALTLTETEPRREKLFQLKAFQAALASEPNPRNPYGRRANRAARSLRPDPRRAVAVRHEARPVRPDSENRRSGGCCATLVNTMNGGTLGLWADAL